MLVLDRGSPNTDPGPAHSAFPTAPRQSSVKKGLCKGLGNCLETPDRSVFSETKYQLLPFLTVVLASKNCCFGAVVLEKTLESPLDCREIKPAHLKGNQS